MTVSSNAGYVKFGHGSAQHVRAGFRLGSHNDMTFGEGTSSRAPLRDSAKHSVSELPVNSGVKPSVIRTSQLPGRYASGGFHCRRRDDVLSLTEWHITGPAGRTGSRLQGKFSPGHCQAGYAHSVSGSSAEGYNGQATLNVTF